MPGIFEEVLYALEERIPVFVIGGFGGAAALLARCILGGELATECQLDFHRGQSKRFQMLLKGLDMHGETEQVDALYARLRAVLKTAHADPCHALNNGLDLEQNRRLMLSDRVSEIVALVGLGLRQECTAERQ
jgi:hypothetical protein